MQDSISQEALKSCQLVNAPLLYRAAYQVPFSVLKYAITLDGKIAASSGHAAWKNCCAQVCYDKYHPLLVHYMEEPFCWQAYDYAKVSSYNFLVAACGKCGNAEHAIQVTEVFVSSTTVSIAIMLVRKVEPKDFSNILPETTKQSRAETVLFNHWPSTSSINDRPHNNDSGGDQSTVKLDDAAVTHIDKHRCQLMLVALARTHPQAI